MLSRVLDFFRRDKAKKALPITTIIANPTPRETVDKAGSPWISRWARFRKRFRLQKDINKGIHVAHPRHVLKPLRPIQPQRFFYSTRDIK